MWAKEAETLSQAEALVATADFVEDTKPRSSSKRHHENSGSKKRAKRSSSYRDRYYSTYFLTSR